MTWRLRIERAVVAIVGVMIVVDVGLFFYVRSVRGTVHAPSLLYRFPDEPMSVSPPAGFKSGGLKVSIPENNMYWVVRYVARRCPYCQKDELLWSPLKSKLQQMGVPVIVVVPDARDDYPSNAVALQGCLQEDYVDISWIRQIRLITTPTLLIFEHRRGLIWFHQGMLTAGDSHDVVDAINGAIP